MMEVEAQESWSIWTECDSENGDLFPFVVFIGRQLSDRTAPGM